MPSQSSETTKFCKGYVSDDKLESVDKTKQTLSRLTAHKVSADGAGWMEGGLMTWWGGGDALVCFYRSLQIN